MARPSSIPAPARDLVLQALREADAPMTAYNLLDALKVSGIKSAPIIYRALDALIEQGVVHKIKELGAYVACDCSPDHQHDLSVLAVCGDCHKVRELHDHKIIHQLEGLAGQGIRFQKHAVVELPVICDDCGR